MIIQISVTAHVYFLVTIYNYLNARVLSFRKQLGHLLSMTLIYRFDIVTLIIIDTFLPVMCVLLYYCCFCNLIYCYFCNMLLLFR